jgi:hypothetical protein
MTTLYDTGIYTLPSDINTAKLFGDKGAFLKSAPNARLYDMFDGNFNLKCREPITPAKCYEVPVIKYQNNAVYSDFPRGAGMLDTTFMWADATYDQMRQAVERQNAEVPRFDVEAPNILKENPAFGLMTGGNQKLVNESVEQYKSLVTLEKEQTLRNYLRTQGVDEASIDKIVDESKAEETAKSYKAVEAGVLGPTAQEIFKSALTEARLRRAAETQGLPVSESGALFEDTEGNILRPSGGGGKRESRKQNRGERAAASAAAGGVPITAANAGLPAPPAPVRERRRSIDSYNVPFHRRKDLKPLPLTTTQQLIMKATVAPHRMPEPNPFAAMIAAEEKMVSDRQAASAKAHSHKVAEMVRQAASAKAHSHKVAEKDGYRRTKDKSSLNF